MMISSDSLIRVRVGRGTGRCPIFDGTTRCGSPPPCSLADSADSGHPTPANSLCLDQPDPLNQQPRARHTRHNHRRLSPSCHDRSNGLATSAHAATMSNFRRAAPGGAPPAGPSILQTLQAAEMIDTKPLLPAGMAEPRALSRRVDRVPYPTDTRRRRQRSSPPSSTTSPWPT